jgi:hypothetical protein
MKKIMAMVILILPLLAAAQPSGMGGFGGMRPPGGPGGEPGEDPSKMIEKEKAEIADAMEKAVEGADLINPTTEAFLVFADQVCSLPAVSGSWTSVKQELDSVTQGSDRQSAFEKYDRYLTELGQKVDVLDSLWGDEIAGGLVQQSDTLASLRSQLETGLDLARQAVKKLEEFIAKQQEMIARISSIDASRLPEGAPSPKEMIFDLARHVQEISAVVERARSQIRIGEIILSKISDITQ